MDFKSENDEIVWEIDGELLERMKHAEFKNEFASPHFRAINGKWYFAMCPNGWKAKGKAVLGISCASSKENEDEYSFCYYIEIAETNFAQKNLNGDIIKKGTYLELESPYLFENIQTLSTLTVYVKIWKPNTLSPKEEDVMINTLENRSKIGVLLNDIMKMESYKLKIGVYPYKIQYHLFKFISEFVLTSINTQYSKYNMNITNETKENDDEEKKELIATNDENDNEFLIECQVND
eukprot:106139_1